MSNHAPASLLLLVATAIPAAAQVRGTPSPDLTASRRTAIVTAAARVAPAVVSVSVLKRERSVPQDPWDLVPRLGGAARRRTGR